MSATSCTKNVNAMHIINLVITSETHSSDYLEHAASAKGAGFWAHVRKEPLNRSMSVRDPINFTGPAAG